MSTTTDTLARRRAALRVVAAAERAAGLHRRLAPRRYRLADDLAWQEGADLADAPAEVRPTELPSDATVVRATSRASLVRFGKFDRDGSVRARAYLLGADPVALKVQTDRRDGRHGIDREVRARREVDALVPGLAPRLHATGHLARHEVSWLAEEVVAGVHPAGPKHVSRVADALVGALAPLYRASGYTTAPSSQVLGASSAERFADVVRVEPRLRRFVPAVEVLLAQDLDLELAFAHGDVVGSNVLVQDDGRVILVDWEYARRRPVADDLASVLTQAHDKPGAIAIIERHLGRDVGVRPTSFSLREQLVVAQVQMLSWYAHRRERAEAAGRLDALERDTGRRVAALRALLG